MSVKAASPTPSSSTASSRSTGSARRPSSTSSVRKKLYNYDNLEPSERKLVHVVANDKTTSKRNILGRSGIFTHEVIETSM